MTQPPRWLLNENFPQPATRRLREAGWDVAAISDDQPSVVIAHAGKIARW